MSQRGRRNRYKIMTTSTKPTTAHVIYPQQASKDCEPKAAGGNGSGPLQQLPARVGPATSIVLATVCGSLMQSIDEFLPKPEVAKPLMLNRSNKSQCFHYQPNKIICTNSKMHSKTSSTTSHQQLDITISRITSSQTSSSTCRPKGHLSQLLLTFTLVAGICLIGAQCAPTNSIKITSQVNVALSEQQQQTSQQDSRNQEKSMVLIELASDKAESLNNQQQEKREKQHHETQNADDDTILLLLTSDSPSSPIKKGTSSSPLIKRQVKRSGISDQRLAEIQMIRALKKQLEKASKLAASSNLNSAGQESDSS